MRYTRYEYKKSSKMKFLFSVIIIVAMSMVCGFYISKLIFKGKQITDNNNPSYSVQENNSTKVQNFIALQCGYFSKQENAQAELNKISSYQSFMVEEDGKYRVIAGIYQEEQGIKKINELTSKGIEVRKIDLSIPANSDENKKIIEIIDGLFKITNKLQESEVKSIKTSDYKVWVDKIVNDGSGTKSDNMDKLVDYVKQLPEELDKSNININVQKLYELIKVYKGDIS